MTLTGETETIDIGMPKNHSLQKLGDLTAAIPVTLVNSYRTNSRDTDNRFFIHVSRLVLFEKIWNWSILAVWIVDSKFIYEAYRH